MVVGEVNLYYFQTQSYVSVSIKWCVASIAIENILAIARVTLQKSNILFGVGVLENAYHETCKVEVIDADKIEQREPALLEEAKTLNARLYFDQLDVLIIDEIGKDISGTGFDTNVVGRFHTPYASGGPDITRIATLDISEKSHGNGNGPGASA